MKKDCIAIGHCRVSRGDKTEIQNSLKSQKTEILAFAKRLGINKNQIDWFIEEEARSSFQERANWKPFEDKIEEACKNSNIAYFISYSQERFCRNSRRSKTYKEKLRNNDIEVRFVTSDVENPETIEGFILDSTNEMVAQMYSMKVSKDTLRGCKENAKTRDADTGYVYKNGGKPPFWLMSKELTIGNDLKGKAIKKVIWVENSKQHTAIINNKPVTKTMWDWAKYYFIDLRLNKEISIKRARDILNELGIPAPRGDKWENTCLYSAEKNEALYGLSIYNKRKYAGNGRGKVKDAKEWVREENAHPALLTLEQFNALKILRNSMNRKRSGDKKVSMGNDKLFVNNTEKYYCLSCGHKIISSGDFYTCGKYNSQGRAGCGSPYFAVPAAWLEEKVINDIKSSFTDSALKRTYKDFVEELKNQLKPDTKNQKVLEKEIKKLDSDIKTLSKTLTDFALSGNEIATKAIANELQKVSKEKELIKEELIEIQNIKPVVIPSFDEFKKQSLIAKSLLSPEYN